VYTEGDIVQLKSGGPKMTVSWTQITSGGQKVYVNWFNNVGDNKSDSFSENMLKYGSEI